MSLLVAGWDDDRPYLFQCDPSVSSSLDILATEWLKRDQVTGVTEADNHNTTISCLLKMSFFVESKDTRLDFQPLFGKRARAPPPNSRLDSSGCLC